MKNGTCPKCGSSDVMTGVHTIDRIQGGSFDLSILIDGKPQYGFSHSLRAWICGECGYTELFVDNPKQVLMAYQSQEEE